MSYQLDSQQVHELGAFFRVRVGWQSFTPTLYQNGTPFHTVNSAQYYADDKLAHVLVSITCTGAGGGAGNLIYVLLPTYLTPSTAAITSLPIGKFTLLDTGTAYYAGNAFYGGIVTALVAIGGLGYNVANGFGIAPSMNLANGDEVGIDLTYRLT